MLRIHKNTLRDIFLPLALSRGKHRNDFQHILHQFVLIIGDFGLVDDDGFRLELFTHGKNQFGPKSQQPVLMNDDEPFPIIAHNAL
jgi:hypothetical protein